MGSCLGRQSSSSNKSASRSSSHRSTSSLFTDCLWRHRADDQDADLISNLGDSYQHKRFIFRIWNFKRKKRTQFLEKFWQHQDTNYAKLSNGNNNESLSDIQLQNLDVSNLLMNSGITKESSINYIPSRVPSSRASSSLDLEWEHEYGQTRHFQQQRHIHQQQQPDKTHTAMHCVENQNYMNLTGNSSKDETSADESASWPFMQHEEEQLKSFASSLMDQPIIQNKYDKERFNEKKALIKSNNRWPRTASITRNSSHNSWSHISTPESLEWDIDEEQQEQLKLEDDNLDHETLKLLHQIEQLKNRVLYETGEYRDSNTIEEQSNDTNWQNNLRMAQDTSNTKCFQIGESDGENCNYS